MLKNCLHSKRSSNYMGHHNADNLGPKEYVVVGRFSLGPKQ